MKISIDTKEDSVEDIRKLIKMLLSLIGDSSGYSSDRTPPASGEGLFDMFGDPAASTSEQQQIGKQADGSTDINDFIDKDAQQADDEDIKLVPY